MFLGVFGRKSFSSADNLIQRLNLTHFSPSHYFISGIYNLKSFLYCAVFQILGGLYVNVTDVWGGKAKNACIIFFTLLGSFAFVKLRD